MRSKQHRQNTTASRSAQGCIGEGEGTSEAAPEAVGGWRRLPNRLGNYCRLQTPRQTWWHLASGRQWLSMGWAPWRGGWGGGYLPPSQCIPDSVSRQAVHGRRLVVDRPRPAADPMVQGDTDDAAAPSRQAPHSTASESSPRPLVESQAHASPRSGRALGHWASHRSQ